MRVWIVYPRFERFLEAYPELGEIPPVVGLWKYRMPPALGPQILAAMTPPEIDVRIVDENVEPIDYDESVDLVAISYFTPQAGSAYRIGDRFRARGVPVVMGGMHPSMLPDDAGLHADAVCVGEAEGVWPTILEDARLGRLRPRYGPRYPAPSEWVKPRRELLELGAYEWYPALVQAARGCPRPCPYCSIPGIYGRAMRFREARDVADEVLSLSGRDVYVTEDVVMFTNKSVARYATELFERIAAGGGSRLFLTSSLVMNFREPFLDLLARAGARSLYVTFGFDPVSRGIYDGDPKMVELGAELVRRTEARGIRFYGAFGVGFDEDSPATFDRIREFCDGSDLRLAEFFVATPFPSTPMWDELKAEGRLLHQRFDEYNGAHVVFQPKQLSPDQLVEGFLGLWRSFWAGRDVERALDCFAYRGGPSRF